MSELRYHTDSNHVVQLYAATLDNTGNNNTTCKTIQEIHSHRGLVWKSDEQQLPYVQLFFLYFPYLEEFLGVWGMLSTLGMLTLCKI
jgi:hypothetical protein